MRAGLVRAPGKSLVLPAIGYELIRIAPVLCTVVQGVNQHIDKCAFWHNKLPNLSWLIAKPAHDISAITACLTISDKKSPLEVHLVLCKLHMRMLVLPWEARNHREHPH